MQNKQFNCSSPTMVLEHNITSRFELGNDFFRDQITEKVNNTDIMPFIDYKTDRENILPPCADCIQKAIRVQEHFLDFLWAFIYSSFVQIENNMKEQLGDVGIGETIVKRAQLLMAWALSLLKNITNWDIQLPHPRKDDVADEEGYYEKKVNGLFVDTLCVLLWHEAYHIINGHCKEKLKETDREKDNLFSQDCEREADINAMEILIDGELDQEKRMRKGIPILFAFITPLFLIKNAEALNQDTHLDLDVRLGNMINLLNITDQKQAYYLYAFGNVLLEKYYNMNSVLFQNYNIHKPNIAGKTPNDIFDEYLDKIRQLKEILNK
jgi:hypothetical protein